MSAAKLDALCAGGPWTVVGEHWSDPPRTITGAELRAYYEAVRDGRYAPDAMGVAFQSDRKANKAAQLLRAAGLIAFEDGKWAVTE